VNPRSSIVTVGALLVVAAACSSDPEPEPTIQPRALPEVPHGRARLRWKRFRAVQHDLSRALALPERGVCTERTGQQCAANGPVTLKDWLRSENVPEDQLEEECKKRQGSTECVDGVFIPYDNPRGAHVITLGGNNTMLAGIHDPIVEPIVTTPIAVDRMVLSACGERAALDVEGSPEVFTLFNIASLVVDDSTDGVVATIEDLYRRLLARSATDAETEALLGLLSDPISGEEFARLSCFVIATTPEFIFQ
jgi:hypothetical protein